MTKFRAMVVLTAVISASPMVCKADPFGAASAYNLFAVGSTTMAGTINDSADVQGRIAAASTISGTFTLAAGLQSDPWGADATVGGVTYDFVAGGGYTSGISNINGANGSAYKTSGSGAFNFNGGGHLVGSGPVPIDFNTLRTQLDAETIYLGTLGANGTIIGTGNGNGGNPSWYVIKATQPGLNVFTISAAILASNQIDIVTTDPSQTILINVLDSGTVTVGQSLLLNGNQYFNDEHTSKILINAPNATNFVGNAEVDSSVLAPFALITGGDFDGNVIGAAIGATGEIHNIEFDGTIPSPPTTPPVPEPGTLALVGTGVLSVATAVRRKKKAIAQS